ncbi:MAG TPA: hypothetical protein VGD60_09400 [Candidatus Acidoferrales bacterium]
MRGPIIIFDKSALQSLSADEAVWLDNFFQSNLTPLFFIETLADLEKQVRKGKKSEDVVGDIALKTPDREAYPNAHHHRLGLAELFGWDTVAMDGRGVLAGGKPVTLNGQKGVMFSQSPEDEALHRWQRRDFLGAERNVATRWRGALAISDYEQPYRFFRNHFLGGKSLKDFEAVKARADEIIEAKDRESSLRLGMNLFGVLPEAQGKILERFRANGTPQISEFAPYFRFLYSVELFFYFGLASDLISRDRPSNKVDMAYLYYLPFCKIFTSKDWLHEQAVPLFMRSNQTFVRSDELKADLAKLDAFYSALPEKIKRSGLHRFAAHPPEDTSFLVTRLWDTYMTGWREWKEKQKEVSPELQEALRKLSEKVKRESQPGNPRESFTIGEANYLHMEGKARRRKGKWDIFGPDAGKKA